MSGTNDTYLSALSLREVCQVADLKEWLAAGQTVGPTQTDGPQRPPAAMHTNCRSNRSQRHRIRQRSQAIHSCDFFNALTDPDLLDVVDQQLPAHRERLFPPTTTLSLFMAQTLNSDTSCQATMDRHVVERIANDLSPCSTSTGAYCKARQRLPLTMVRSLLQHTGHWVDKGTGVIKLRSAIT